MAVHLLRSVFINRRLKTRRDVGPLPIEELEERFRLFVEAPAGAEAPSGGVEARARAGRMRWRLRSATPPEAFRSAVLLVDVQELSYEEAAALDCPVGTVRSRPFRGRRLFSAALEHYARRVGYLRPGGP